MDGSLPIQTQTPGTIRNSRNGRVRQPLSSGFWKFRLRLYLVLLCLCTQTGAGCRPKLISLDPEVGPERTLVEFRHKGKWTNLRWDGQLIASSLRRNERAFFSVPPNVALATHNARLHWYSFLSSNIKTFTVQPAQPFVPRLDRISLWQPTFPQVGKVQTWLYVQGANIDVGAAVLVNGTAVPTAAHRAIRNDLFDIDLSSLEHPIYHYVALVAAPGLRDAGEKIHVEIRNVDGVLTKAESYTLPNDPQTVDSDGDNIPDVWEATAVDFDEDGSVDEMENLPALGAHPYRPDVFVEVDVMDDLIYRPKDETFETVVAAFAAAPIINPEGPNGITLHVDHSGSVEYATTIDFPDRSDEPDVIDFFALKDMKAPSQVFHYCIWANESYSRATGRSDMESFSNGRSGNDFYISMDSFPQTVRDQAELFMHELGHNLGQRHGGSVSSSYNPSYSSVMSYSWALRTLNHERSIVHYVDVDQPSCTDPLVWETNPNRCICYEEYGFDPTDWRLNTPVYTPLYYGSADGLEGEDGKLPAEVGTVIDYSDGMGRTLDESNLDEPVGLFNDRPIDWDNSGTIDTVPIDIDIDWNCIFGAKLPDHPNWINLQYQGPAMGGRFP